jgi:hypothetical protein
MLILAVRAYTQFAIVRNQVTHRRDLDLIRIVFLWTVIDDGIGKSEEFFS